MAEEITGEKNTFFELEKVLKEKLIKSLSIDLSKNESRKIKKSQTESFEAFSAYASSIDAFDKGEYEKSIQFLEVATNEDDEFDIAWEKLDELEKNLKAFTEARKTNISKEILDMMIRVQNGEEDCRNLAGALSTLWYDLNGQTSLLQIPELYEKLSNDKGYWLKNGGFKTPPNSIFEVSKHIENKTIETVNIIKYLVENNFGAICGSEFTYGQPFIDNLVSRLIMPLYSLQIPFLMKAKSLYNNELKGLKYFDQELFGIATMLVKEYKYSAWIEFNTVFLARIIERKKNPILYEFHEDRVKFLKSFYPPNHFSLTPESSSIYDRKATEITLYSSDMKNVHIPRGLELFKEILETVTIEFFPLDKDPDYILEQFKGTNSIRIEENTPLYVHPDTLTIPKEIYSLKNLKKLSFSLNPKHLIYSDKIKQLINLEEISVPRHQEEEFKKIFPNSKVQ